MRSLITGAILTLIMIFLLCDNSDAQSITFTDRAKELGITYNYNAPFFGGGISFCDFDGDGNDDLTLSSQSGEMIQIYKNQIWIFQLNTIMMNILDTSHSKTLLWVDFDNDGDKDLFISNYNAPDRLYRNVGGGNFDDITSSSGISNESTYTTAACWADYDNDGLLDLYLGTYNQLQKNYLYHNNGDGTFSDVSDIAGVTDTLGSTNLYKVPLAIISFDYNNDGWLDFYIANDKMQGNNLYKNNGDGTFSDVSAESNSNLRFNAMGITVGDYDNDGDFDIYVSNSAEGNGLLRNNGDGTFTEIAASLGLTMNKICWGTNFIDYDNDGDLDLFVAASHGDDMGDPDNRNLLFENLGDGTFSQTSEIGMDYDFSHSTGTAIGDFNNDGYYDIAVMNSTPSLFSLWQNSGGSNNWIKIKLEGTISNRDGIGSIIEIYRGAEKFIRSTHCGLSYLSQNSTVLTIGVGDVNLVDSVIINWPSGHIDVMRNVNVNSFYVVEEGSTVTDINEVETTLTSYKLHQNYPNPFNPSTKINFSLAADSRVTLTVFDVLGQEVANLISGNLAAGSHEINFSARGGSASGGNASNINSGVYFYRLDAVGVDGANFTFVKKMILMK